MANRPDNPWVGENDEVRPHSKRRGNRPAKGYKPAPEKDKFGIRKSSRRPDLDDEDPYLDLGDADSEDDEDFDDIDEDFDDEDFGDDDFFSLDDPDDFL